MPKQWLIYEDAARKVLSDLGSHLGITTVDGKQVLKGESGASWEIDAKACCEDDCGFLVVEVRRHMNSRLSQEQVAAVAFRIEDLGAQGGITVAPLPLQKGASIVAASKSIAHVMLDPQSTPESYLAEFMGKVFHSVSLTDSASAIDSCDATVVKAAC
jgi:hypothetical protein